VLGLLVVLALNHPLVVVDGEGTCPAPAEVEARLDALIPRVDEREPQDRAVLERISTGLRIDLRRDDGERLAERLLAGNGSCKDLAAAAAVVIAAWELHLKPEIAGRANLPGADRPSAAVETAPRPPASAAIEARVGMLASLAGSDVAPGAILAGSITPAAHRLGAAVGLSGAAQRVQTVSQSSSGGARWMRGVLALGPQYRFDLPGRFKLDLHADGLLGLLHVEGTSSGALIGDPTATWSARSDLTVQLGAGAGVRAFHVWGTLAAWVGLRALVWPGHQRVVVVVDGNPAAAGEIPRLDAELAVGASWGRFP
jgi:hypothetical protein